MNIPNHQFKKHIEGCKDEEANNLYGHGHLKL